MKTLVSSKDGVIAIMQLLTILAVAPFIMLVSYVSI
jgi:hypothetical protein